jgi:hypothetical protein
MTAMKDRDDRRMFAPLRRGTPISPEAKLVAVLRRHAAGATAARLADELVRGSFAVGTLAPLTKRISEILGELEGAAIVERIPDGRYRVVAPEGKG